ncbi:hypothetical protein IJ670_07865 [bacterium]|nr:hypothetical protein [bacterium]
MGLEEIPAIQPRFSPVTFPSGYGKQGASKSTGVNSYEARGEQWKGFSVPEYTGTGELRPTYGAGERKIDYYC